jgi:hypothetical protein
MGQLNLSQISSLPDIIKNSKWNARFSKMPAVSGFTSTDVDLRAVTMDVPKASVGVIETTIRENTIRTPGRKTYSQTLTLTLLETVDAKTMEFIRQWRELCNEYNTNKIASRNSREATILLYLCDDTWSDAWSWKIDRAWLSDYTLPQLGDGSSPEAIKPSLTLAYTSFLDNKLV